jgi:ATP synthase F1 delta subunit
MSFFDSLISNYVEAIILTTYPDDINKIIKDLWYLNDLLFELQSNYSQYLFNSHQGQSVIANLIKNLEISPVAKNLFITLVKNGRLAILPLICRYLPQVVNQRSGVYTAEIRSVSALKEDELKDISKKLTEMFDKKFEIENIIDLKILGGISVRFDSFLIDSSIVSKLKKAKKYLSEYKLEYVR